MNKKILISFDASWILEHRDDEVLPVELIIQTFKEIFGMEVLDSSLSECEFVLSDSTLSEEELGKKLKDVIKDKFNQPNNDFVEIQFFEYIKKEDSVENSPKVEKKAEVVSENNEKSAIEKIHELVGAEEFKLLADEYVKVTPEIVRCNAYEAFLHQSYLFAVNDGNGLSTYLNLFAGFLKENGLFKTDSDIKIVEEKLGAPNSNEKNPFASVISLFSMYNAKNGRIICIDISEWMTKTADTQFRDFLMMLDENSEGTIFVFRIPFVEKNILQQIKRNLEDILFVRDVSFVPFDNSELNVCAEKSLSERGFAMHEDAWEVFNARIAEEKTDGRFYGINTVNKVIREMIYKKLLSNAENGLSDNIIKKSDISGLASEYSLSEKNALHLLDEYIGMDEVKKRILEIVTQIEASVKNKNLGAPCIHMRFIGNPGTGKTTVARIIGKILKEKGILRNGGFFEYTGRDFCGRYVGETAPKTAAMCRDAYGSVMFIDEAYSLYRGDGHSNVDYGREAIDTLISEMENHRSDLVVIMAGYPGDMDKLMEANVGLESRMPYIIEFPNYTREQLAEIFMLMVKKSFKYDEGFESAVKTYFNELPDDIYESKEFSNARFVRNLYERTWGKSVMRTQFSKNDELCLSKEDFNIASTEKEFTKSLMKQKNTLGFV